MKQAICLILIINSFFAQAQSLTQTMDLANDLHKQKSYVNALELYKRVAFFDSSDHYQNTLYAAMADCYYNTDQYDQASKYYDIAYFKTENDSLKSEYALSKTSCFLLLKQLDFAELEIMNLDTSKLVNSQSKKLKLYQGIINFGNGKFEESEQNFLAIVKDTSAIKKIFIANKKISKINPRKAKILSMIMPGLGQFYVGDIKNGLNSLLLNAGLFALGVNAAKTNGIFDAMISVVPWIQRYYQGGFYKAEIIANNKIFQKRNKIYNQILDTYEAN